MSMKKQFHVSFDVTATLSDEQEAEFAEGLKGLAKGPRDQRQDRILVQALTYGPEGAIEALIREGLREAIRELQHEVEQQEIGAGECTLRFSPATVRAKS